MPEQPSRASWGSLRVTLLYAGLLTLILISGALMNRMTVPPRELPILHIAIGLVYAAAALVVFLWVMRRFRSLQGETSRALLERDRALEEAHNSHAQIEQLREQLQVRIAERHSAAVVDDSTERKRAEDALRYSEEQFRSLVENAPYGIFRCTREGKFLQVNPALVQMLCFDSAEELIAAGLSSICLEHERRERMFTDLTPTGTFSGEVRWRCKDGHEITVRLSGRADSSASNGQPFFQAIAEDITQQVLLAEQLRHAQKMEAVGLLAGGIAHDFNNILMAISGYAEILPFQDSPEGIARISDSIRNTAMRASRLTQQLLAFSRKQVLDPKVLDPGSLVVESAEMLRRLLGAQVKFFVSIDPHLGRVKVDPTQVDQVLFNLVANARDAMPDGGSLTLALRNHKIGGEGGDPAVAGIPPGPWVELRVSDTGIGMDSETRQRIFEPFFTTKPKGKGTGLGLATVYGIVRQSGGHVLVDSMPGRGSTFRIFFPRVYDKVMPASESAGLGTTRLAQNLLLVEDEQAVRDCLRGYLQSCGFSVLEAKDGDHAVQIADSSEQPIDFVVSDIVLPGLSGPEAVQRVLARHPRARVLYMSGFTDDRLTRHGVEREHCLKKPFALGDLHAMLQRISEQQRLN